MLPTESAVIWVDGPDAERFLQGLLSNDIAGLGSGQDLLALFLNDKGHIRSGLIVRRDGVDSFIVVAEPVAAEHTAALFREYHFSEDLEITGPERSDAALVVGALEAPDTAELVVADWIPGARLALIAAPYADPDPATAAALIELLRVEAGIPRFGVDTDARSLPHETGLIDRVISFDKGCYLGQEAVARVEHRGGVRRHLRGVRTADALPPGTALYSGERVVGTLTSSVESPRHGPIGLAVVRDDAAGERLAAAGEPAEVVELPF